MQTTQDQQDQDKKDFADQFAQDDVAKTEPTEDEVFGVDGGGTEAAGAGAEMPAAVAGAEGAAAPAAEDPAATEQKRLQDWEATLATRESELNERTAAMATTNAGETQTGNENTGGEGAESGPATAPAASAGEDDPAKALAEDFGPEFVDLLIRLVKKICGDQVGGVQETVQSVIDHLNGEKHQAHFKTIASAHEDFVDVIESPEFEAYRAAQAPAEQSDIDRVVASGSAQEIIDMLTKFKGAKGGQSGADDESMDAAEGVRSSGGGLTLPAKPTNSKSFEDAWNEQ